MSEKVLGEIRVIETEDGFRIEVKGDKERMRQMGFDPGMGFAFGRRFGRRPHGHHRHGHGHHRKHWSGAGPGPWGWGWWWGEPDEDEDREQPAKEA